MDIHELTDDEREQMLEALFKKLNIERKHLVKEELEREIIDYVAQITVAEGLSPLSLKVQKYMVVAS